MNKTATNFIIRISDETDFEAIVALLKEFAWFQKTPDKVLISAKQMKEDKDLFHCLIAENKTRLLSVLLLFFRLIIPGPARQCMLIIYMLSSHTEVIELESNY